MGFRELVKKVQEYSGFSDIESEDALEHMVESLAVRLNEGERKDFASQLPQELQDIALAVYPHPDTFSQDIIEQFMEEGLEEDHAKKQIISAWEALKETISRGEIEHIRAQLPNETAAYLR